MDKAIKDYDIIRLEVEYENDSGTIEKVIDNVEKIERIKGQLISSECDVNPVLNPLDDKYEILAVYRNQGSNTFGTFRCVVAEGVRF